MGSLQLGTLVSDLRRCQAHWQLIRTLNCEEEEFLDLASHNDTPVLTPMGNKFSQLGQYNASNNGEGRTRHCKFSSKCI